MLQTILQIYLIGENQTAVKMWGALYFINITTQNVHIHYADRMPGDSSDSFFLEN